MPLLRLPRSSDDSSIQLQLDRLAVSQEMNAGARCQASDMLGEGRSRQIDQIGALGEPMGHHVPQCTGTARTG